MGDVSTEGAVYLCNNLYTDYETYGVKSMLCTGAAWDSMLDFIKDSTHSVTDSTTWGNYAYSETYKVYRGYYTNHIGYGWLDEYEPINITEGTNIDKGSAVLLTTGATERNSNKNLYDIAGNCAEWTTEANDAKRGFRGGNFNESAAQGSASLLVAFSVSASSAFDVGFRPLLYIY